MQIELDALHHNNTWEFVPLPAGHKPIGSKWVFKKKYKSDNSLDRYKVCVVAKGYTQVERVDYHETFHPLPNSLLSIVFLPLLLPALGSFIS
ncbi:hypothetical protein C1H46_032360 [Malus baccata]|uniref:Reverse transcriptase Ty1/copia-type domain-containing protein n=1 Tax=Malus baccata TaxID=106549 RepID=A0A540L730_MALBA|nr:hypothetical protein C1H46_032360 [Malus baccata]